MSGRIGAALGLGFALALLGATAWAQEHWSAAERERIFATLPNWNGLWESRVSALSDNLTGYPTAAIAANRSPPSDISRLLSRSLYGKPPYRPGWEREHQAELDAAKHGKPGKLCRDVPFPALLQLPLMFQVFVTPEETLFLYENGDVRHIYTDRKHPKKEDLWPTKRGNSIGHWEGATLVIDTIEVEPESRGPQLSDRAHFVERVRLIDPNTLEDDLTVEDPQRLAHPWQVVTRWSRVLDEDRMLPYDCENDRNPIVNGKFTIAPPR